MKESKAKNSQSNKVLPLSEIYKDYEAPNKFFASTQNTKTISTMAPTTLRQMGNPYQFF